MERTSTVWTHADKVETSAPTPLFDQAWNKPVAKPYRRSLESAFREFHRDHPEILDAFVTEARRLFASGERKAGAKRIAEGLRWGHTIARGAGEDFKVPNAHVAFYARLVLHRAPDLGADFFDLAAQRGVVPFDPSTVTP
jgi:hypothetical protein